MELKKTNYTKFFCEENIWHLCQNHQLSSSEMIVLFISNTEHNCPFWYQQAAPAHQLVWWDYHVILAVNLESWYIYDFDSTLPYPADLHNYFDKTFQYIAREQSQYCPKFKIINSNEFTSDFYSDRSHMIDSNGEWLASPPSWPLIESSKKLSLKELLNFTTASNQRIFSQSEMIDQFKSFSEKQ